MTRAEFIELIKPERRRAILSIVVAVAQGILLYPALWLIRELFDVVIPSGNSWLALVLCGGILVARLATAEISLLQRNLARRASKGASAHRRRKLSRWLLESDIAKLENEDPSIVHTRLVNDTERLDVMLNRVLSVVVPSAISTLIAVAAMTVVEWRLALVTIVLGVPASWLAARGGNVATSATRAFQASFERFSSSTRFAVRHLLFVRSRGNVSGEQVRQDAAIDDLRDRGITMANSYSRQGRRQTISMTTIALAVLALGSLLVIDKHLTVGGLAAFYLSALVCANMVGVLGGSVPDIKGGIIATERLHELTDHITNTSPNGTHVPLGILPLRFKDVHFSYLERPVLAGVRLEIAAGSHVDLGGANGAGKSTLVRLVLGLERPTAGTIIAAEVALDDLDGELFRKRIGYAAQKPTFFSGTVAENLLYGRPDATRADAEIAAELAGIALTVNALDGGFDAPLGEDGVRLSGGEGQRLAIARALIGDPELVVLDEPGNHLPLRAVAEIIGRVRLARPDIALLTIGHGHLALGVADLSLRLSEGTLTEVRIDA